MDVRMFVNSNVRNAYIWVLQESLPKNSGNRQLKKIKINTLKYLFKLAFNKKTSND